MALCLIEYNDSSTVNFTQCTAFQVGHILTESHVWTSF